MTTVSHPRPRARGTAVLAGTRLQVVPISKIPKMFPIFGPGNGSPMAGHERCCCWGSCCYEIFDSLRLCRSSTDRYDTSENILHQATVADFFLI